LDIKEFAEKYRVRTRRDSCNEDIITGKLGHIYEHSTAKLGVLFMPSAPRARLWSVVKSKGTAAGMTIRQNTESEGTLLFDPASPEQAKPALTLVRIKTKRIMSEAQALVLAKARIRLPQTIALEGVSAARTHEPAENDKRVAA